jgi:hypothetical protein
MQVIDAGAVAVLQTMRTMSLLEDQISRAIGDDDELSVKAHPIEHFVADEPAHAPIAQVCQSRRTDVAQEMVQSLMHRQGGLVGASQLVEISQDTQFQVTEFVIQVAAAAQLETEQQQPPPEQKARFIGDQDLPASVGQLVAPTIETGPEVANGFKEDAAQR